MARYDQCDSTCTVDCGHCKGHGRPAYLSGPPGSAVLQYTSGPVPAYPEGYEPSCTCPPDGPCADAECDACWRLPAGHCPAREAAVDGRDQVIELMQPALAVELMQAALAKARPAPAVHEGFDRIAGIATLHDLDRQDLTSWSVCLCADALHGPLDGFTCTDEAQARTERTFTAGAHLVSRRRMVLTAPAVVVTP